MLARSSRGSLSSQGRRLRALVGLAFALFLFGSTTIYLQPKAPSRTASSWPSASSDSALQPVVEIEGLNLGRLFIAPADASSVGDPLEWLLSTVKLRYNATIQAAEAREPEYPTCTLDPDRYQRTALRPTQQSDRWKRTKRTAVVSIAINLHDSALIIPAQSMALLEAITYLLAYNKIYISIFENGSVDSTHALLSDFGAALQVLGVDGIFIHASRMQSAFGYNDRIVMLAEIRNLALKPLIPYAGSGTLIFLNDVVTCASDILELVHQQRLQQADMTFGMDWGSTPRRIRSGEPNFPGYADIASTDTPRIYDTWVARGINGELIYPFERPGGYNPASFNETWVSDCFLTQTPADHQRWLDGLPLPVYSGWGGMAAFDASLFTHEHLRFRSSITAGWSGGSSTGALGSWGTLVSAPGYAHQDCPGASECEYIARDIWNLRHGRARIVVAPQARTTYTILEWEVMGNGVDPAPTRLRAGVDRHGVEVIEWGNVSVPESVVCLPSRTKEGVLIEIWDEENLRYGLHPMYRRPNGSEGVRGEGKATAVEGSETESWREVGQDSQTEDLQTEALQSEDSQTGDSKTGDSQTEDSQTEDSQSEDSQIENSQTMKS